MQSVLSLSLSLFFSVAVRSVSTPSNNITDNRHRRGQREQPRRQGPGRLLSVKFSRRPGADPPGRLRNRGEGIKSKFYGRLLRKKQPPPLLDRPRNRGSSGWFRIRTARSRAVKWAGLLPVST